MDNANSDAPHSPVGRPAMKYKIVLDESEEGFAVSAPNLPGCHSQGATEDEALENIKDAIREYLAAITMGHIVRDAGLTNDEFRDLL
jgi:predicted RNase H-like HicB family nuclease